MTKTGPRIALITLLLVALLVAGAVGISQADGGDGSRQEVPPITDDDRLEQIAKENPGFGGYYRDRDDRSIVTVLMTDVSKREVAERVARAVVDDPDSIREVRIEKADFEFTDLAGWYRLLTDHMWAAVDEITASCISEDTNRIEIGISDLSARDKITGVLNELGIPVNAVTIEEEPGVIALPLKVNKFGSEFIIILAAVGAFVCLGTAVSGYWLLKRKRRSR